MRKEEYGLATFKSTHYAMQSEKVFKDKNIIFKTIPTPREVSHSCGLALLFSLDYLELVVNMIDNDEIKVDGLYRFIKDGLNTSAEKIN